MAPGDGGTTEVGTSSALVLSGGKLDGAGMTPLFVAGVGSGVGATGATGSGSSFGAGGS